MAYRLRAREDGQGSGEGARANTIIQTMNRLLTAGRMLGLLLLAGPAWGDRAGEAVPALQVGLADDFTVVVSWPGDAGGFVLEVADTLVPSDWRAITGASTLVNNRWTRTLPLDAKTRFFRLRGAGTAFSLEAALASDSGVSDHDGITATALISGQVSDRGAVAGLVAGIDATPSADFISVLDQVNATGGLVLDAARLDPAGGIPLADGPHTLHLRARNAAGAMVGEAAVSFTLDTAAPRITLNPADGQQDVLPRQLIVATFSEPVVIGARAGGGVNADLTGILSLTAFGVAVPGRLVLDETGTRLSLVPSNDLSGGAEFQIAIDASRIFDRAGNPAIGPTQPTTFRTANNQAIPGTSLMGWVFAAERGADGGEAPLAGAQVSVANNPATATVTDANGQFVLNNLPGGKLLIDVDGHSVKSPAGTFYPSVTKLFEAVSGKSKIIDVPIYLPLVPNAAFVTLSTNATTAVANPAQLAGWALAVPPNAVQRRDGTLGQKISISPVPPDRLPAPLPPGLSPKLVITIQTDGGADVFTQPVPLTAPNLEGLPPGAKTVLWDFDHGQGIFVPVATATVSADGQTVTTDPGQGVVRPGWHFILDVTTDTFNLYYAKKPPKCPNETDQHYQDRLAEFKRRQLALQLDAGALALDGASLIPGCGAVAGLAGAGAGAYRDAVVGLSPAPSMTRDSLVGAGGASDFVTSRAADGYRRAIEDLKGNNFANAAKNLGRVGKFMKGALGIFAALNAIDDYETLQEDIDAMKLALKDPPGDFSSQALEGLTGLREAVTDAKTAIVQGLIEYLEGLIPVETVLLTYGNRPLDQPVPEPDRSRWLAAAQDGQQHLQTAAGLFGPPMVGKINTVITRARDLAGLLLEPVSDRVYYKYSPAGGAASSGTSFNPIVLTLPFGAAGQIVAVEPVRGLIGSATVAVPAAASSLNFTLPAQSIYLYESEAPDLDGNGLPDDLDPALGNPTSAQVAGLRAGLGPEEGGVAAQGIIGRLTQRIQYGPVVSVGNTYADMVAGDRVLYGIGGTNALEVIDISRPGSPVKIGYLRGGSGYAGYARGSRVAVSGFGVRVYDAADPRQPTLVRQIDYTVAGTDRVNPVLGANHVVVSKDKSLLSFDLDTGRQVSAVSLADIGAPVRMQLDGDIIYVLTYEPPPKLQFCLTTVRFDAEGKLALVGEVRPFFWSTGSLPYPYGLAVDDRAAFIGPWLISADPFIPGFGTIDITDPAKPSVIASPSTNLITGAALLATDNHGHLLTTVAGTAQNHLLEVFDVSDLKRTDNRILTIPLDDVPYAPAFTAGLAVFATAGDIYVARLVAPDGGKQPPVIVNVVLPGGTNVVEGRRFGVHAKVTDDVQVARVEVLLQGDTVVTSDATYPYDLDFLPPASLPDGQPLALTVRATDTGGNHSEQTFNLTYRAKAPRVLAVTPPPGFTTKLDLTGATIAFDKPLNRSFITAASFALRGAGPDHTFGTADDPLFPLASAAMNADNTQVKLDFGAPLPVGRYQLTAKANPLRDFGGNKLDGEFTGTLPSGDGQAGGDFTTGFEVQVPPEFALDSFQFRGFRTDAHSYYDFPQINSSPLVVADVNGDGRADFVRTVFDPRGGTNEYQVVAVTLQNADGTFADPVTYPTPDNPIRVLVGDVNGDGFADLVTVHFDTAYHGTDLTARPFGLSLLLGNGDGTFQAPKTVDTGGRLVLEEGVFILGDFTGRDRADLAQLIPTVLQRNSEFQVTNRIPANLLVYPAAGGTLGPPVRSVLGSGATNLVAESYRTLAVADLNHDGIMDLAARDDGYGPQAQGLALLSRGDGTFTVVPQPLFADLGANLVLADFTGDGELDAISGNLFYRGLGGGRFEWVKNEGLKANGVQNYTISPGLVADFNGDGRLDYATAIPSPSYAYQTLGLFTNKADGTFELMKTVRLTPNTNGRGPIGVADLNGDGWPDLLFNTGDGSTLPYYAYVLFSAPGGGFDAPPAVENLGLLGLSELPLLADLNGDGRPDLVSYLRNPNPIPAVAVMPSQAGGFGAVTTNLIGTTNQNFFVRALGAGDFTGDGKLDIIAAEYNSLYSAAAGEVYLLAGNGDGTLQKGRLLAGPKNVLAVADFDGDGKPDILAYDFSPANGAVLVVFPGRGDGTLGPPIITLSDRSFTFSGPLLVGDFNHDGKPDLLIASYAGGGLGVWLNDGKGRFSLASSTTGTPSRWELQGLGDFNRDGNLDVLMNDRTGDIPSYKLVVLPGDGTGKLGAPLLPTPFPGVYNSKAVVADINHDGTPDLVIAGYSPDSLREARVSLGNGDGTFQPPISFFGGDAGLGGEVMAADFNGDGLIDLLVGQSMLLQKPAQKP